MEIDVETLNRLGFTTYHTGSREICNPPSLDTDDDYLVFASGDYFAILPRLLELSGWDRGGIEYNRIPEFWSWRKGPVNLIVTGNSGFYDKFVLATRVAKEMNLLMKVDRIHLFEAILYQTGPLYSPDVDYRTYVKEPDFGFGIAL